MTPNELELADISKFRWISADNPPEGPGSIWSVTVIVVTDHGRVCMNAYMNSDNDENGCWQRLRSWNPGEKAMWWIYPPMIYADTDMP